MSLLISASCFRFGGTSTPIKPETIAEMETGLKEVREDVDKSKKEYSDIAGNVTAFEQRLTKIETNITTIQSQVSVIETKISNFNTPFWEIITPIIIGYIVWELLKILKAYLVVRHNLKQGRYQGSAFKNLLGIR